MNSIPDFMRDLLDGHLGFVPDASEETGADVDAFNDAFEEVYCEFLSRRVARENHLQLGTAVMVDRLMAAMEKIRNRYQAKRPARREDLVEMVLTGLEILSTKRKGE